MDLATQRLRLRPLQTADADALYCLIDNWNVVRWLTSTPWPYTRPDMDEFIAHAAQADPSVGTPLAIIVDGAPAGVFGYRHRRDEAGQPSANTHIGYWLGEPYWGRGYMTEAACAVIANLFATTSTPAIASGVLVGNAASLQIQMKLGFLETGRAMLLSRPHGYAMPCIRTLLPRAAFART